MHTLTENEMPRHCHLQYVTANPGLGSYNTRQDFVKDANGLERYSHINTEYTGGGASHNNLPPYRAVNIWRRTA